MKLCGCGGKSGGGRKDFGLWAVKKKFGREMPAAPHLAVAGAVSVGTGRWGRMYLRT